MCLLGCLGFGRMGYAQQGAMVFIEGGSFSMGCHSDERNCESDEALHTVTLNDFSLSATELTFEEYAQFCRAKGRPIIDDAGWGRGQRPIIHVSWYDALEYCNWRSKMEGLTPCYTIYKRKVESNRDCFFDEEIWPVEWDQSADGYRLPTEAEWEYAARERGQKVLYGNGKQQAESTDIRFAASMPSEYQTEAVASFQPNALGLYDMSGNVREWCWDWYNGAYYTYADSNNPMGPDHGCYKVVRGGSWGSSLREIRTSDRASETPGMNTSRGIGFRLCRNAKEEAQVHLDIIEAKDENPPQITITYPPIERSLGITPTYSAQTSQIRLLGYAEDPSGIQRIRISGKEVSLKTPGAARTEFWVELELKEGKNMLWMEGKDGKGNVHMPPLRFSIRCEE